MKKPTFSEFLTFIEDIANAELQKQECQDLISDFHSLQSLTDFEMAKRIKNLDPETGVSDTDLQKIVPRIKSVNFSESPGSKEDEQALFFLLAIVSRNYREKYKGDKLLEKNNAIARVFTANQMKEKIKQIQEEYPVQNIEDYPIGPLVYETYYLGILDGLLGLLGFVKHPHLQEIIHGIHSGRIVLKRRYANKRKQYEEALAIARKLWEQGDELMHHKMARYLVSSPFSNLPLAPLREKLIPIAKEFGKFYDPTKGKQKK